MENFLIRQAGINDLVEMLHIYAPFANESAVSFEYAAPSAAEFEKRFTDNPKHYPWLVAEKKGQIAGYAYASAYRSRTAYQWSVETSIYMKEEEQGTGTASLLYQTLLDTLERSGFFNAYAIITTPNPQSERFHEKMGFENCGLLPRAGYKNGSWHDVRWMWKRLQKEDIIPSTSSPFFIPPDSLSEK